MPGPVKLSHERYVGDCPGMGRLTALLAEVVFSGRTVSRACTRKSYARL